MPMTMPDLPLFVSVLVGIGLLLAGRKLFWLFVGGVGFLVGFTLAQQYLVEQSEGMRLVMAAGIGIAGAVLAYVAQKIAISVGGFLAGGFLGVTLVRELLHISEPVPVALFFIAGIAGLVLVHIVFDWALVVLSSVAGATVISELFTVSDGAHLALVVVLAAVGVAVQKGMIMPKKARQSERRTGRERKEARRGETPAAEQKPDEH
jgi:hypothetical protein